MSVRYWPDSLPHVSQDEYQLAPVAQTVGTDMEAGPRRVRRLTTARHDMVRASWRMTDSELAALRAWYGGEAWSLAGSSEDVTGWTATNVAVTGEASAGPGYELASRIVEDDSTGQHRIRRTLDAGLVAGGQAVIRATLKARGRTKARLRATNTADTVCSAQADLTAGTMSYSANVVSATATARGNGWYRLEMVIETGDGSGVSDPYVELLLVDDAGEISYEGDDESGVDVCEINARIVTGHDLYLPTDADGNAYGSAADSAWFQAQLPRGGGFSWVEARFTGGFSARPLNGLNWLVSAPLETRYA